MYAADPSALVEKAKNAGVDLTKRYVKGLDVVYSEIMGKKPSVPKFDAVTPLQVPPGGTPDF